MGHDPQVLEDAFAKFGAVVDARVVMEQDNPTRSRGFGFVQFEQHADALKAKEAMHGTELDGRPIKCDICYVQATNRREGGPEGVKGQIDGSRREAANNGPQDTSSSWASFRGTPTRTAFVAASAASAK